MQLLTRKTFFFLKREFFQTTAFSATEKNIVYILYIILRKNTLQLFLIWSPPPPYPNVDIREFTEKLQGVGFFLPFDWAWQKKKPFPLDFFRIFLYFPDRSGSTVLFFHRKKEEEKFSISKIIQTSLNQILLGSRDPLLGLGRITGGVSFYFFFWFHEIK